MTSFTPLSAYSSNIFQQNSVQKCMTIMCIIVTEEDLFKKHAKKVPFFCPFSNLPQKCCPAAVQGTFKNDSKYHICPYNCNTRPEFRVQKKIWGSRALSSALLYSLGCTGWSRPQHGWRRRSGDSETRLWPHFSHLRSGGWVGRLLHVASQICCLCQHLFLPQIMTYYI